MRFPGYLKLVEVRRGAEPGTAEFVVHVRRWHPSLWAECWRAFRQLRVELTVLGRTFVLQEGGGGP